jgi:hypothetical protein
MFITAWTITAVFDYGMLCFSVNGIGNDRFAALPVKWEVRNHVGSLSSGAVSY